MQKEIRKDILNVLNKVQPLLQKEEINKLKFLSNLTIHNAGLFQDKDSISISVIIFSLSKIFNRPRLEKSQGLIIFKKNITEELLIAKNAIEKEKEVQYQDSIKRIFKLISTFEKKFGMYITEVLEHAKIKRGGRIYEHGFSAGKTAQLLGISSWELMSYLGETKLENKFIGDRISTKERLKFTRELFSL